MEKTSMSKSLYAKRYGLLLFILFSIIAVSTQAQTTAFTYQGRFTDLTVVQPTNGIYNMSFALYDAVAGGAQVGPTIIIPAVQVTNGIFTVSLDYTAAGFDGTERFLEIAVTNIVLSPRQEITNSPYAIMAQNALRANKADDSDQLGGIDADQYVTGQVVRSVNNVTGNLTLVPGSNITITPVGNTLTIASTGGSGNFIENSTVQQPTSNFNVSGNGTTGGTFSANIVSSQTNFRIGGTTVFSTPNSTSVVVGQSSNHTLTGIESAFFGRQAGEFSNNLSQANTFIGFTSGRSNTSGSSNSFVGKGSGFNNNAGSFNSFFGAGAGNSNNVDGSSFFGYRAGYLNGTGLRNSFFGFEAGQSVQNTSDNSFFGYKAGDNTSSGDNNSFFGSSTGIVNSTGDNNAFFGSSAGLANNTGNENAFFGFSAGRSNTFGAKNTFIGTNAGRFNINQSNNTYIGYQSGGITGGANTTIGSGANVTGSGNTNIGYGSFINGNTNTAIGINTLIQGATPVNHSTAIGADAVVTTDYTVVLGSSSDTVQIPNKLVVSGTTDLNVLNVTGKLYLPYLAPSINGEFHLCTNLSAIVYRCGFPIFNIAQSSSSQTDTTSSSVDSTLINQSKPMTFDWQMQIQAQAEQIQQQQVQIEALKQIVCAMNPAAKLCGNQ